jgi:hypothetical protein
MADVSTCVSHDMKLNAIRQVGNACFITGAPFFITRHCDFYFTDIIEKGQILRGK